MDLLSLAVDRLSPSIRSIDAHQAVGGLGSFNDERLEHGEPPATLAMYVVSDQFWFESFQNWQSEFLSLASMVWLSVYLRERGCPESKRVATPHDETDD
jgi:hypothetical protein